MLAGILYACRQYEDEPGVDQQFTVDEARVWHEAQKIGYIELKSGGNEKKVKYVKPDWSRAIRTETENEEVVETEIMTDGMFGFVTPKCRTQLSDELFSHSALNSIIVLLLKSKIMRSRIFIFAALLFMSINLNAQTTCEGFIIGKEKNKYSNIDILTIIDAGFPNKYEQPKGENGKNIEMLIDLPYKRISWIANSVFNSDEILKLKENKCIIELIIYSTGDIKSVSYKYINPKEEINLKKLQEFSKILKKEIKANSASFKEVKIPGYFSHFVLLYQMIPYNKRYGDVDK